jgi:hypothetical protein
MNYSDIQHRFANRLEGKNGCIKAGNVRYEGRNYYSYSTVFGQWLDIEKNVVAIFDGSTSPSSSKHKLYKGLFPDDVHVFPYNDNRGGWYSYDGCDLMGWTDEFTFKHRCILIDYYVTKIYNSLAAINGGKKKGLENVSFKAWGYIEELCSLYKDTSIAKYLKWTKNKDYKKLVKMLKSGTREVPYLVDQLFGRGTWMQYWDYCARYRKSADKRSKVEALCNRLGIRSPYEKWCGYNVLDHEMSADDIRKLTAKERLDLHFKALAHKEYEEHEDERKKKYNNNFRNAYKWIVGFEPKKESWGGGYESDVYNNAINKDNGVVYECSGEYIYRFYWCKTSVSFDYDSFRKSEDKEQWIADFYAMCKEVADNRKAILTIKRINAHTKEKANRWDDDIYINDSYLRENTTEAEYAICAEFIRKQDKYFADEEARRRAAEIARLKREEEERKEREYQEKVKQEQIDECLSRGIEGKRDLWRKHLQGLYDIYIKDDDFYMGGNVLLRLNLNKDKVETSKNIRIPVEVCKKMWKIVSKWHENPSCFKEMEVDTKGSGKYTISSYENDILTAGCHKIAYTEMERMYNEIININVA